MNLTLEVTRQDAGTSGVQKVVFDAAGGTIGRLPENRLVLADPYVSSRHAVIRCVNGAFYIEDTSTNGVCVNTPGNRLAAGVPYALKPNDVILIDAYEIRATLSNDPLPARDLFGLDSEEVDPLKLLDMEGPQRRRATPRDDILERGSVLSEPMRAPVVVASLPAAARGANAAGGLIPDDYDPLMSELRPVAVTPPASPAPVPPVAAIPAESAPVAAALTPRPSSPPRPDVRKPTARRLEERPAPDVSAGGAPDSSLGAFLEGAGIDPAAVTPELARMFGQILRVVVSGVMDVLQARQQTKEEFRMGMTRFKAADNNPLKFSANVEDALHNLLVKRNPAYLGPVEAFEDAFEDLRNHQMATLSGLRVAFDAMLAEFDPDRLQAEFDGERKRHPALAAIARLRYWERYREKFQAMNRDEEAAFRELFGDEFAKAYQEQLKRLKARRRN
jgi:type VI secretion system FHA domain protein